MLLYSIGSYKVLLLRSHSHSPSHYSLHNIVRVCSHTSHLLRLDSVRIPIVSMYSYWRLLPLQSIPRLLGSQCLALLLLYLVRSMHNHRVVCLHSPLSQSILWLFLDTMGYLCSRLNSLPVVESLALLYLLDIRLRRLLSRCKYLGLRY